MTTIQDHVGPGWVYRVYDESGRLIYVGSTTDAFARMIGHRNSSWWAYQAAKVKIAVFPSLELARAAERAAIRDEHPRWNVMGRWATRGLWAAEQYEDYYTAIICSPTGDRSTYNRTHLNKVISEARRRYGIDLEQVPA